MTPNKDKTIEQEKLVAEKLNGRLAMLGIIAGIGAYLTTGQLIQVSYNEKRTSTLKSCTVHLYGGSYLCYTYRCTGIIT